MAPPHHLHHHRTRGPTKGRGESQKRAEDAVKLPGLDYQDQAAQRQAHREPLGPAKPLTEERPGHQQNPELPGIGEDGGTARSSGDKSGDRKAYEASRLKQPDRHHVQGGLRPDRSPESGGENEQYHASRKRTQRREGEGRTVGDANLQRHPGISPDEGENTERDKRQVAAGVGDSEPSHATGSTVGRRAMARSSPRSRSPFPASRRSRRRPPPWRRRAPA